MRNVFTATRLDGVLPWICVAALGLRDLALALAYPSADGDRFWQRWLGERILHEHAIPRTLGAETLTSTGAPWTPQEWLFSVVLAWSQDHMMAWLVPGVCALAATLALGTVVTRCARRGTSPVIASAAVIVSGLAMIQSFGVRAQVLGWAGLGVLVWCLESEGPWAWAAIPVTLVWANLHASAMLAPAVATLFALSTARQDRAWTPAVRRSAAIAVGCAAATLATPLGADLPRYSVDLLSNPIRAAISEWGPTSTASAAFVLGALPIVLTLAVFGVRSALRDRVLALAFTLFLFGAVRNVPMFALATAPIAAAALSSRARRDVVRTVTERRAALVTVLAMTFVAIVIPTATWRAAPAEDTTLPLGPARTLLATAHTPPRVFCEDFAWCSIFLLEPRPARFFMDGRCDPYPAAVWRAYLLVLNGNTGWAHVLDANRIDAVLVRRDGALDSLLAERSGLWRPLATDGRSRVYVRDQPLASRPAR